MALSIPNLDKIQKTDPKLGEAVSALRQYINLNVAQTPGNRTPLPPIDPTNIRG